MGQVAVLGVSTANAVTAILAEDLRTSLGSTAQMGVGVVGLCRKHKVLSQSNSHEDTLQTVLQLNVAACVNGVNHQ